jgi:hypothetical protein
MITDAEEDNVPAMNRSGGSAENRWATGAQARRFVAYFEQPFLTVLLGQRIVQGVYGPRLPVWDVRGISLPGSLNA